MGLSQTDFAKLVGHSRSGQASYERGDNIPGGAYLSALHAIGVDVLYILTGNRTPEKTYTSDEQALIEKYRAMNEAARLNMQAVSAAFASAKSDKKIKNG